MQNLKKTKDVMARSWVAIAEISTVHVNMSRWKLDSCRADLGLSQTASETRNQYQN